MAIYIGADNESKRCIVEDYIKTFNINKIVHLRGFEGFKIENAELVEYSSITSHVVFYRLMREINNRTLVVIDECLQNQDRYLIPNKIEPI